MTDIDHTLSDRLRLLVAREEPPATLRGGIEAQLSQPPRPRNGAPRVLAVATVAVAFVLGAVALVGDGPDSEQQVSALTAPVPDLPHGRSSTRVLVSNATQTPATAEMTLERLQAAGYIGAGSMDAPELWRTSKVYFAPGYEAEARDVALLLGLDESAVNRTPPPVPEPNGAEVLVVAGSDLTG